MSKREIYIIGCVFLISLLVRLPNLNRPLSKHHEFNAAFFMIPMEIWNESSIFRYHGSPVLNYENPSDKGINNFTVGNTSYRNSYYYLSFGAGSYVIPYFFMQLFGGPSILYLQIFSILIHLVSTLFLIALTKSIFRLNSLDEKYALIAGIAFLLLPHTLWFNGNGYTHHSLVVLFFLGSVWATFKWITEENSTLYGTLYFLFLFLTIYTEWIGCILGCTNILVVFFIFKNKSWAYLSLTLAAILSSLGLIYWQYASLIGGDRLVDYLTNRFFARSDLDNISSGYVYFFKRMTFWFMVGYLPLLAFILYLTVKAKSFSKIIQTFKQVAILLIPSWIHHFVFSEFSAAHDYSVLIDAVYLCIITAILSFHIHLLYFSRRKLGIVAITYAVSTILIFYGINRPGEVSQRGERYDSFKQIGEFIKLEASKDEVIFIQGLNDLPCPQVLYYAKRNFYTIQHESEIKAKLHTRTEKKAVFFKIKNYEIAHYEHLE
jgi:hypothetical protein